MYLEKITQVNDIKKLDEKELPLLAEEIRTFLIESISKTGGHLGSNLGAVELTMALHLSLNLPEDKIVFDVGHQSYTHKILTGRKEGFATLRKYGGMSGFPKRKESDCDSFDTGHSSTSISAGLGLVKARDLKGEKNTVVSVIGDGALTGGMAYEALNNAAELNTNFIIILNDNKMSIAENVGGVPQYLNDIRTSSSYIGLRDDIYYKLLKLPKGDHMVNRVRKVKNSLKQLIVPGMFFEDMGITYLGPIDGHDIKAMQRVLEEAKHINKACIVHVVTQKGKGYEPAERHPARFHGAEPFDLEKGIPLNKKEPSYTDIFATIMCKLGERNDNVVAITAAMPDGTGLKRFHNRFPERFFDVGIAEEHAVTFAAGLAAGGLVPIVAVYSSFLQRAYDQILHDVCIQDLPVVFAIDRAGLVGADGETHQGIFDFSYLSSIPNMHIMAPKNIWEFSDMMKFAVKFGHPIAIRYPRGSAFDGLKEFRVPVELGKGEILYEEEDICLFAVGSMVKTALEVRNKLKEMGYSCSLVNARFVKPIDTDIIDEVSKSHRLIVCMEENVECGGLSEHVRTYMDKMRYDSHVLSISIPDAYVEHGNVDLLKEELGLDADSIVKRIVAEGAGK